MHVRVTAALILGASITLIMAGCQLGSGERHDPTPTAQTGASAVPPASAGALQPVAMMTEPRAVQTATRLSDGSVLVVGGCTDLGCELGSGGQVAEVFDPSTDRFESVGSLVSGFRDDHTATPLSDDRVLIAGGWGTSGVVRTTELFQPESRTFSAGPDMNSPRAGFTAVRLRDGRVLLAGGFTDNDPTTRAADLFDPSADSIDPTGSMRQPRGAYAAALMPDGRVLVAGGIDSGHVLATAEVYDPATGRFTPTGMMSRPRYKAGAIALGDGSIMVLGGSADVEGQHLYASTEIYDPAAGTFTPGPTMTSPRYKIGTSLAALANGDILVAGGAAQVERYEAGTRTFEPVEGSLDGTRLFLTATRLDRGRVLLLGGYDSEIRPTDQAWLYGST